MVRWEGPEGGGRGQKEVGRARRRREGGRGESVDSGETRNEEKIKKGEKICVCISCCYGIKFHQHPLPWLEGTLPGQLLQIQLVVYERVCVLEALDTRLVRPSNCPLKPTLHALQ